MSIAGSTKRLCHIECRARTLGNAFHVRTTLKDKRHNYCANIFGFCVAHDERTIGSPLQ